MVFVDVSTENFILRPKKKSRLRNVTFGTLRDLLLTNRLIYDLGSLFRTYLFSPSGTIQLDTQVTKPEPKIASRYTMSFSVDSIWFGKVYFV